MGEHDSLTNALIELLRSEGSIDEDRVRRAVARALRQLRQERQAHAPPAPSAKGPTLGRPRRPWARRTDDGWMIVVEVTERGRFLELGQQLHGDLRLKLEVAPPVDEDVDLCVLIPAVREELWFRGRVTWSRGSDVRVEVEPAMADHPQRWNRASTAFSTAEFPAITPGASREPTTTPPRLASGRSASRLSTASGSRRKRGRQSTRSQPSVPVVARETARSGTHRRLSRSRGNQRTATQEISTIAGQHSGTRETRPSRRNTSPHATRTGEFPRTRRGESKPVPAREPPSLAKLLVQLRNKCARIGNADHFTMLGVHWSAHQERIDAAFAEEMWLLQSSHYPASFSPVDDLERHRLVKALEHAYATLGDPESRRAYRAEIHDASEIAAAVKVYRDKADMALFRRQKSQARDPLLRVQELDPENSFAREHLREFDPAT